MSDARNHPARTLQRVAFETSRLAEFCGGEKELTAQTGPHRRIGRSLSPRSSRVLITAQPWTSLGRGAGAAGGRLGGATVTKAERLLATPSAPTGRDPRRHGISIRHANSAARSM
jgi:hypothetical protein